MGSFNRAVVLFVVVSSFSAGEQGSVKEAAVPHFVKRFSERIRQGKAFTDAEVKRFFSLPVDYSGFDLDKNDENCRPPKERRKIKTPKALKPVLEHFRIELGKGELLPKAGDLVSFVSQEIGDCSHDTEIKLNVKGDKIIFIKLSTDKVY